MSLTNEVIPKEREISCRNKRDGQLSLLWRGLHRIQNTYKMVLVTLFLCYVYSSSSFCVQSDIFFLKCWFSYCKSLISQGVVKLSEMMRFGFQRVLELRALNINWLTLLMRNASNCIRLSVKGRRSKSARLMRVKCYLTTKRWFYETVQSAVNYRHSTIRNFLDSWK